MTKLADDWAGFKETAAADQQAKRLDLAGVVVSESELDALDIPKRKPLLGDWFFEGDLGFVTAKRGVGKTWLGLHMARALADGSECGPWKAHTAVKVLYIDGEMPLDEMRDRNAELRTKGPTENVFVLSHQLVFDRQERNLCLSDPECQEALTQICAERGIRVVFIDNQSTLITRVRENSADDWRDLIEGWLLGFRRRGIAVVVINHAGRNGEMRGTSKREDPAFWSIMLEAVEGTGDGAEFGSRFTKNRNAVKDPAQLRWHFCPSGDGVTVTYAELDPIDALVEWVREGFSHCSEIAEVMGISKGQVSKLAKKAEKAGKLKIVGRLYKLTDDDEG